MTTLAIMNEPQVLLNDGHMKGPVCIMVSPWQGRTLVRLSRCQVDRNGIVQPGGIGFSLDAENFGTFYAALNAFVNAQRANGKAKPKAVQPAA